MRNKLFFLTAFAAAAIITASMSTILAGNQDSFTLKYKDTGRIHYSTADSTDTTDGGGIRIPPIGN